MSDDPSPWEGDRPGADDVRPALDIADAQAVADALKRLAAGRPLADTVVARLPVIDQRLRDAGLAPSATAREWAAGQVLSEIIQHQLAAARRNDASLGAEGSPRPLDGTRRGMPPAAEADERRADRRAIAGDFAAEDMAREAWSCLFYRFIDSPTWPVQQLADIVRPTTPHGRKLIVRRSALGFRLLAAALIDASRATGAIPRQRGAETPPTARRRGRDGGRAAIDALRARVVQHGLPTALAPDEASAIASVSPSSLDEYCLTRIAAWSRARFALDRRFVALSLLIDQGEHATGVRWARQPQRLESLSDALAEVPEPALVLLGAPGCGKSTLLRRHELDLAVEAVRDAGGHRNGDGDHGGVEGRDRSLRRTSAPPLPVYVELARFAPHHARPLPDPIEWLCDGWAARYPHLPPLADLLAAGRAVVLLDALNEMPHHSTSDFRRRVQAWGAALASMRQAHAANQIVVSCRSLDYSAPLSSDALRVPHVHIDPLDDDRIRSFLAEHCPAQADAVWAMLVARGHLDLVRTPYFLRLLAEAAGRGDAVPDGPAALITAMVRGALQREIERANPVFDPGPLVAERDYWRVVQARAWRSEHELPTRGALFTTLTELAYGMQDFGLHGEATQVCLPYDDACRRLGGEAGADGAEVAKLVLTAAEALGVIDDDAGADDVRFVHQRLQEYFAARRLAANPEPPRVAAPWRAQEVEPRLGEVIETLPPGETLPALPQTGWEETALLAAAMTPDVPAFVRDLLAVNPPLAGRCATLPEVHRRLPALLLDDVRWTLVMRSRDPEADVRARMAAAAVLGPLGDPRFERRTGPHGAYLLPPMVELPGGVTTIGSNDAWEFLGQPSSRHAPEHDVRLARYALGAFPVTNAEFASFVAAGGYDDERWWPTAAAEAWRIGRDTGAGRRNEVLALWDRFAADGAVLEDLFAKGHMRRPIYENWRRHLSMSREAFAAWLVTRVPDQRVTQPKGWLSPRGDPLLDPVAGLSWYEALAYCRWLAAQTGQPFRLPTEVEIEAACRRMPANQERYDRHGMPRHNVSWAHLGAKSPIGVFPAGDTADGLADMMGNVMTWTSTAWGSAPDDSEWPYPYDPTDGREALDAPPERLRLIRGSFFGGELCVWERHCTPPGFREMSVGFRLARST